MTRKVTLTLMALILSAPAAFADLCDFDSTNPFTAVTFATALADPSCDVIDLPPGTYDMGEWGFPFVQHPVTLRGSGRTALVVNFSQEGGTAPPSRLYRFIRTNADLTIENLELRNFSKGIKVDPEDTTVLDVVLRDVTFVNMGDGILSDGPDQVIVQNPHTDRNTGVSRFEVRDSTFRDVDAPINLNQATMQDVRIEDNRFTGVAGVAIILGDAIYDPREKRAKMFVRGNFIERVNGAAVQSVKPYRAGILLHGNFCFVQDNFVRDVPPPAGGWSTGIYTKCMYSKVTENTIFDAGGAFEAKNGAITIKGKEREETNGSFGFGALVSGNHIIFRDTSPTHRVGVKVHAGYTYVTDNVIENATLANQVVGVTDVTIDLEVTSDPNVLDHDGTIEWTASLP